jgi:dUTP pyrophosphatase
MGQTQSLSGDVDTTTLVDSSNQTNPKGCNTEKEENTNNSSDEEDELDEYVKNAIRNMIKKQVRKDLQSYYWMMRPRISYKKLDDNVQSLTKNNGNAGFDLRSNIDTTINPGDRKIIPTGIVLSMTDEVFGKIESRSGLAIKNYISTEGGVIDSNYRGEVGVILSNSSPTEVFTIKQGDRIAQLVFINIVNDITEVTFLDETERGDNGFGSSGTN